MQIRTVSGYCELQGLISFIDLVNASWRSLAGVALGLQAAGANGFAVERSGADRSGAAAVWGKLLQQTPPRVLS